MLNTRTIPFFYVALLLSPAGGAAVYICLAIWGICKGAMGSGITCSSVLGPFEGYFVTLGFYSEISMIFFGAGLVWILYGASLFITLLHSAFVATTAETSEHISVKRFFLAPFSWKYILFAILSFGFMIGLRIALLAT